MSEVGELLPESGLKVTGLAVPYMTWVEISNPREGHFWEAFAPGVFAESTAARLRRRVAGFIDHAKSRLFGSAAVMDLKRIWEAPDGLRFEGDLVDGLPAFVVSGLRKGLYGVSVAALPTLTDYGRREGLESRLYRKAELHEISLTATPVYTATNVTVRSQAAPPGAILRVSPAAPAVTSAWRIEAPPPRDYLAEPRDYLADDELPAGGWRL